MASQVQRQMSIETVMLAICEQMIQMIKTDLSLRAKDISEWICDALIVEIFIPNEFDTVMDAICEQMIPMIKSDATAKDISEAILTALTEAKITLLPHKSETHALKNMSYWHAVKTKKIKNFMDMEFQKCWEKTYSEKPDHMEWWEWRYALEKFAGRRLPFLPTVFARPSK